MRASVSAVSGDAFEATAVLRRAGEMAAEGDGCVGVGPDRVRFLDRLGWIEPGDVTARLKVIMQCPIKRSTACASSPIAASPADAT